MLAASSRPAAGSRVSIPSRCKQELFCIGFRNEYDIALNRYGDLFTYDADMEWDMGSPWYRPTRICHVVSGGDYGWRSGTGKWPTYYEDSLPPVVDIGPGSPTGVVVRHRREISRQIPGRDLRARLDLRHDLRDPPAPDGAGYTGQSEPFVTGFAAARHRCGRRRGRCLVLHSRRPGNPVGVVSRALRRERIDHTGLSRAVACNSASGPRGKETTRSLPR